nr:MAG TPA: hypothetical protein [Caudoviricetes sp.]
MSDLICNSNLHDAQNAYEIAHPYIFKPPILRLLTNTETEYRLCP